MPDGAKKGSFVQGFNAQAAVDSQTQVIVAAEITQQTNDSRQLIPMIKQVAANTGAKPIAVSADAGYWSEANVKDESVAGVDLHCRASRLGGTGEDVGRVRFGGAESCRITGA